MGGAFSGYTKMMEGELSGYTKIMGGELSGYIKMMGGELSGYTKMMGGTLSGYTKMMGGELSGYTKMMGGELSGYTKMMGGELPGYTKMMGGELSRRRMYILSDIHCMSMLQLGIFVLIFLFSCIKSFITAFDFCGNFVGALHHFMVLQNKKQTYRPVNGRSINDLPWTWVNRQA